MENYSDAGQNMTEEDFVAQYGDVEVQMGPATMQLNQALAMEAAFCPADDGKRTDPAKRMARLAMMVSGSGALAPEHQYLLPQPENET